MAATTHGLLFQTPDERWKWVCDEAWGGDPRTALLATEAATWVATTGGAAWSSDGCTWTRSQELEGRVVLSLWEDDLGGLMAASPDALLRADAVSSVFSVWARAPDGIVLRAAARSDGEAVWALGFDGDIPTAWRVEDGDWNPTLLPALGNRIEPLWTDPDGALLARLPAAQGADRLVRVDPVGGVTILVDTRLPIRAAWVEQAAFYVSVEALGTMRSDDQGASWTAPSGPALACHHVRDGQRIACLDDGRSTIFAAADPEDTHPARWRWTDGPGYASVERPQCDAGVLPTCDAVWASVREAFGGSERTGDTADLAPSGAPTPPASGCGGGAVVGLIGLPMLGMRRRRGQQRTSRRIRGTDPTR